MLLIVFSMLLILRVGHCPVLTKQFVVPFDGYFPDKFLHVLPLKFLFDQIFFKS